MKYARVLLEHCPQDTTRLFIDYYTGKYRPKKDPPLSTDPTPQSGAVSAVQNLASYLPYINTASITSPGSAGNQKATISEAQIAETHDVQPSPEYNIPRPRTAFSSFVDHPDEFIVFLEACLKEDDIEESDKIDLYTTMFEMYLDKAKDNRGNEKEQWEAKAKALIESKNVWSTHKMCHRSVVYRLDRSQSIPQTSCCCLTFQISEMGQSSSESNRAYGLISFDPIRQRMTPLAPSRHSGNTALKSHSSIQPRWHISRRALAYWKRPVTNSPRS